MNRLAWTALVLLPLAGQTPAQSTADCPLLPPDSGLEWQTSAGPDFQVCRATRAADGQQVFGVYLAGESPFEPVRRNRAEEGRIDGREIYWYEGEQATPADPEVRETLVELDDDRVAHIWMTAADENELRQTIKLAEGLSFKQVRLSGR